MSELMKITMYSQRWPLLAPDFQLQPKGCALQSGTKPQSARGSKNNTRRKSPQLCDPYGQNFYETGS